MAPPLDFNATLAEQLRDAGMQMRAMTKPQKQRVTPDISTDTSPDAAPVAAPVAPPATSPDALPNVSSDDAPHVPPHVSPAPAQAAAAPTVHDSQAAQALEEQDGARRSVHSNDGAARSSTPDSHTDTSAHSAKNGFDSQTATATPSEGVTITEMQTAKSAATSTVSATARDATASSPARTARATPGMTDSATAAATADQTATYPAPTAAGTAVSAADNATAATTDADAVSPTLGRTAHRAALQADAATDGATATVTVEDAAHGTAPLSPAHKEFHSDGNSHDSIISNASSSHGNSHASGYESSPERTPANTYGNSGLDSHSHTQQHTSTDGAAAPSLPDAASELWAMSHHSEAPTLSERSWTGGVRGAVLDALRGLAGGRDHVLVNLKRLAIHTGISYGSVRNAMSRLTRSGDIRTRQIRMADGHGVRVEFLTLPGQEGTGVATLTLVSSQAAVLGQAGLMGQAGGRPQEAQPYSQTSMGMPFPSGEYAPTGQTGNFAASAAQTAPQRGQAMHAGFGSAGHAPSHTAQQAVTMTADPQAISDAAHWTRQQTQGYAPMTTDERGLFYAQQGMTPASQIMTPVQQPMQQSGHQAAQQNTQQNSRPMAALLAPLDGHNAFAAPTPPVHTASFWDTEDSLFTLAWPHVATAGLRMEHVRALAPIFTVQGFDAAVLPRSLRYLDWELEQLGVPEDMDADSAPNVPTDLADAASQLTQTFMRALQRRGTWPRPAGYEEGDD